ncbi:MAG TPA: metallophosphoesterase [Casimicrobiaceae bacterium]|nr:metallophosphoesterase [Casimicrobiaceae bacterium]
MSAMLDDMSPIDAIDERVDRIALCGGPYSNFAAVEAFLAVTHGMPRFCLGDIGGFGPEPNRTLDLVRRNDVVCIQGNYDHAVGFDERDCRCGYIDPLDREYAQISFDYTAKHTSAQHKAWLRELPPQRIIEWRGARILLVYGSPDQVNEFVWDSETGDDTIDGWLARERVSGICATHSDLPWIRRTSRGFWCNVGLLGRPAHDGSRQVGYALLCHDGSRVEPQLVALDYDVVSVAAAMRSAGLPEAFPASLESGLWTTCDNILPAREREPARRYWSSNQQHHGESDARNVAAAQGD